jgi:hypothetical protein
MLCVKACPDDLRRKNVSARERGQRSLRETAELFGVGPAAVRRERGRATLRVPRGDCRARALAPDGTRERRWSKIETFLREARSRTREVLEAAIRRVRATVTGAGAHAWFAHRGYALN